MEALFNMIRKETKADLKAIRKDSEKMLKMASKGLSKAELYAFFSAPKP